MPLSIRELKKCLHLVIEFDDAVNRLEMSGYMNEFFIPKWVWEAMIRGAEAEEKLIFDGFFKKDGTIKKSYKTIAHKSAYEYFNLILA